MMPRIPEVIMMNTQIESRRENGGVRAAKPLYVQADLLSMKHENK
jgi:hypothetical protein